MHHTQDAVRKVEPRDERGHGAIGYLIMQRLTDCAEVKSLRLRGAPGCVIRDLWVYAWSPDATANGPCFLSRPSIDTLCERVSYGRRAVQKALRELESAGLIRWVGAWEKGRLTPRKVIEARPRGRATNPRQAAGGPIVYALAIPPGVVEALPPDALKSLPKDMYIGLFPAEGVPPVRTGVRTPCAQECAPPCAPQFTPRAHWSAHEERLKREEEERHTQAGNARLAVGAPPHSDDGCAGLDACARSDSHSGGGRTDDADADESDASAGAWDEADDDRLLSELTDDERSAACTAIQGVGHAHPDRVLSLARDKGLCVADLKHAMSRAARGGNPAGLLQWHVQSGVRDAEAARRRRIMQSFCESEKADAQAEAEAEQRRRQQEQAEAARESELVAADERFIDAELPAIPDEVLRLLCDAVAELQLDRSEGYNTMRRIRSRERDLSGARLLRQFIDEQMQRAGMATMTEFVDRWRSRSDPRRVAEARGAEARRRILRSVGAPAN